MTHELHKQALELSILADRAIELKHRVAHLEATLATICAGQQSQDETICNLQRRLEQLESDSPNGGERDDGPV